MNINDIAMVCHNLKKALCEVNGDMSQKNWDEITEWQRQSVMSGVEFALNNPNASPGAHHDAWMEHKKENGWKFGPVKDINKKEHPCLVPYEDLSLEEKAKDFLFKEVVHSLSRFVDKL